MAPNVSPEIVSKMLIWILMTVIFAVMIITAIGYYSYIYSNKKYNISMLGRIPTFDYMNLYKRVIIGTLIFVAYLVIGFQINNGLIDNSTIGIFGILLFFVFLFYFFNTIYRTIYNLFNK